MENRKTKKVINEYAHIISGIPVQHCTVWLAFLTSILNCYYKKYNRGYYQRCFYAFDILHYQGDSVAEWLACWTQAQKGLSSNRSRDMGVAAGLAESNGSLLPGL